MKINRNMSAVLTNKQLRRTENKLQQSMERLSSGFKLNSPGDNPAGMAISNKMKAQIDGISQAKANAGDGISVMQIADGALNEVSNMLQRIRELSVQAANGTNGYEDKKAIQEEIDQLCQEVDRISRDTEYNTKTLLNGSSDTRVYADSISRVNISDQVAAGHYQFDINSVGEKPGETLAFTAGTVSADGIVTINGVAANLKAGMTAADVKDALQSTADEAGVEIDWTTNTITDKVYGSSSTLEIEVSASIVGDFTLGPSFQPDPKTGDMESSVSGKNASITLTVNTGSNASLFTSDASWHADGNRVYIQDNNGFTMDFLIDEDVNVTAGPQNVDLEVSEIGRMTLQLGSNQYQTMEVRIPEISSESLYLDTINVSEAKGADRAISTMDAAIAKVSSVRSAIGAYQNRLEYADSSLGETNEDMTAAYSRILDTDMAEEMTTYSQLNILNQATISVLSQANDLPQQVLSLLQ